MSSVINESLLSELNLSRRASGEVKGELGQADFLELMIAQLKNQDPMKPMESGQFLSDIAQFSTVSGIEDLNSSFDGLASSLASNQALMAAGMVGRSVIVDSSQVLLGSSGGVGGNIDVPSSMDNVSVSIFDASGQVVRTLNLGAQTGGVIAYNWDGLNDSGNRAAPGNYSVNVTGRSNGASVSMQTSVSATVESVTLEGNGGGLKLNLGRYGSVDIDDVRQIS